MNSREFARKWLERQGFFDKDSDYDGMLGDAAMEVVELIAGQGHSGASGQLLVCILGTLYMAYQNDNDPIWKEYWANEEGQKRITSFTRGKEQ